MSTVVTFSAFIATLVFLNSWWPSSPHQPGVSEEIGIRRDVDWLNVHGLAPSSPGSFEGGSAHGDGNSGGDGHLGDQGGGHSGTPLAFSPDSLPFFSFDVSAAVEEAHVQIIAADHVAGNMRLFEVAPLLVLGPLCNLTFIHKFIQSWLDGNVPAATSLASPLPRSAPKWGHRPSAHPPAPKALRNRGGGDAASSSQAGSTFGTGACGCRGWRVAGTSHASWLSCLGGHRLYNLDKGGVITPEAHFLANVLPTLPSKISYKAYLKESPGRLEAMQAAATALDSQLGGLYIGMKDCVRSTMCKGDGGEVDDAGMCVACACLERNRAFKERRDRAASFNPLDLNVNVKYDFLTRGELITRLKDRAGEARVDRQRERRGKAAAERDARSSAEMVAAANARAEAALQGVHTLLNELHNAAEKATTAERMAMEKQVELALAAQEHAGTEASLQTMALAMATMQEQLDTERKVAAHAETQAGEATSELAKAKAKVHTATSALAQAQVAHERALERLAASDQERLDATVRDLAEELIRIREAADAEAVRQQSLFEASVDGMLAQAAEQRAAAEWALEEALRTGQQAVAAAAVRHATEVAALRKDHATATAEAEQTAKARADALDVLHEAELSSYPEIIKRLLSAHKLGQLEKHASTTELMTDIAKCLEGGTTRGRKLSPTSQAFYGLLLNNASPWAHKFVAGVLFGPDLRTSQKARAAFESGVLEDGLKEESFTGLKGHLAHYGLQSTPGVISEDATTALRRLDAETITALGEHVPDGVLSAGVRLWGFDGTNTANTKLIKSLDELKELIKAKTALAGYVYVYTWVPILPHAPWFPFAIIATNNKFTNVCSLLPGGLTLVAATILPTDPPPLIGRSGSLLAGGSP